MKKISFTELLDINTQKYPKIAVVGGGGKTSLIFRLTEELAESGKKVIVTTTTHMAYEPDRPFAENGFPEDIQRNLQQYGYTVAAALDRTKNKIGSLEEKTLNSLRNFADVILIEADGAKRLPLKVPEAWEPLIPEWINLVTGVMGLDCLEKTIGETAHRPWNVAAFLGKEEWETVEQKDLVKIAASERGLRKNVGDKAFRVYLNKLDTLKNPKVAEEICKRLKEQGIYAVCGQLKDNSRKITEVSE